MIGTTEALCIISKFDLVNFPPLYYLPKYLKPAFSYFLFCVLALFSNQVCAQQTTQDIYCTPAQNSSFVDSNNVFTVTEIKVKGNKKTKTYIILREILLKEGDTISYRRLKDVLMQSKSLVYNLNLFSEVNIEPGFVDSHSLLLSVAVRERWFLYPIPQFQVTDRNLNEWLKVYHADFDRVIYGAKFIHYNVSGRGDQLKIYLLNGFSRGVSFSYSTPYSNPGLTEGFHINAGYVQNRGLPYQTTYSNKLKWYKPGGYQSSNSRIGIGYSRKRGYYKRTSYAVTYQYIDVGDSVTGANYNPGYFKSTKPYQSFIDLSFGFQYSRLDNINYPMMGRTYGVNVMKRGFNWNGSTSMLGISASYSRYSPLVKKAGLYHALQLFGRLKLPFDQPYFNRRNFGYSDVNLRGLEYYVIDGVAGVLASYTMRKKLFGFKINVPFHIHQVPYIPFSFYAKTYGDAGYSYNKPAYESRLNNIFLYTYGLGIDVLSLYDVNVSFEYSFNQLGENGLFLHLKGGF